MEEMEHAGNTAAADDEATSSNFSLPNFRVGSVPLQNGQFCLQGDPSRCAEPPVDFKTKVPFWPALAWPGQSGTFVLKSTGGFAQGDGSPCRYLEITGLRQRLGRVVFIPFGRNIQKSVSNNR